MQSFNSRSREGSDKIFIGVKIMSPSFNSRSREGSDWGIFFIEEGGEFQFTLPRGERLQTQVKSMIVSMFQFTLPRGERR